MEKEVSEWALVVFNKATHWHTEHRIQHAISREKAIEDWKSYNIGWAVKSCEYYGPVIEGL